MAEDWLGSLLAQLVRDAGLLQPQLHLPGLEVSLTEGLALRELAGAASLSQRDIAEQLHLDKSTVSRLLAGLEDRGMVTRSRDPHNRRWYQVALTDTGRYVARRLHDTYTARHAALLDELTDTERAALATGLAALLRALQHTTTSDHARGTSADQSRR